MIKPNELRIGNLFYKIDRSNTVHLPIEISMKVLEINMFNVLACLADENPAMIKKIPVISLQDLSPIPLTPEILEKCWFRLHKDLVYIYKHHARIRITKQLELLLDGNLWVELKYLHQLQNLYFALTGEELTFKP